MTWIFLRRARLVGSSGSDRNRRVATPIPGYEKLSRRLILPLSLVISSLSFDCESFWLSTAHGEESFLEEADMEAQGLWVCSDPKSGPTCNEREICGETEAACESKKNAACTTCSETPPECPKSEFQGSGSKGQAPKCEPTNLPGQKSETSCLFFEQKREYCASKSCTSASVQCTPTFS